jgi:hypothetical protein
MASKPSSKQTTVNKSATNGRFVSNRSLARHPNTTYKQTVTKKTK